MPEFEAWPGQIEATRMLFETHASSKRGPRCYQHGKKWRKDCSWCEQAKKQVPVWEENKRQETEHEKRLDSGEWSIINLAIELDDHLFERRRGSQAPAARDILEWAFRLAERVHEQAGEINYPTIEEHGQEILAEFRAGFESRPTEAQETTTPGRLSRPSGLTR